MGFVQYTVGFSNVKQKESLRFSTASERGLKTDAEAHYNASSVARSRRYHQLYLVQNSVFKSFPFVIRRKKRGTGNERARTERCLQAE